MVEYELALPELFGGQRGLHGLCTTDKAYARQFARDDNKVCAQHKGKGVYVVRVGEPSALERMAKRGG